MISKTVEYALRAAVQLAKHAPQPSSTANIAKSTKVPQPYLVKILQSLNRAGLVRSQRGLGGGITLASPPAAITILQIVNAVEPFLRIKKCPLGLASHGIRLCPLHRRLDEALAWVEKAFAATTLEEILTEGTGSPPLCELRPKVKRR